MQYNCEIIKVRVPTVERHNDEQPINIILYSDGCTYQNRNVTVSNALLIVAITEKICIEQEYLEVGHTQMKADSKHLTIERFLRNIIINVPADYYGICRDARRNPNKYDVTYLNHIVSGTLRKYISVSALVSLCLYHVRTCPTRALEIITDLTPLHLVIERVSLRPL